MTDELDNLEDSELDDENTTLGDDVLDEVSEDGDEDLSGFGHLDEESDEDEDDEESDEDEEYEDYAELEDDAEDVEYDQFDDIDDM